MGEGYGRGRPGAIARVADFRWPRSGEAGDPRPGEEAGSGPPPPGTLSREQRAVDRGRVGPVPSVRVGERTGAILAAGRGRRMGPLGERVPKTLLPLGPRPLLRHHLEVLEGLGVRRVLVAVGHQAERVEEAVERLRGSALQVSCLRVEPLGTAYALAQLAPRLEGDVVVVLLGDYAFSAPELARMVERAEEVPGSAAIAVRRDLPEALAQGSKVEVGPEGRVVRVVEKPVRPGSGFRGCGVYALRLEALDVVRETPRTALRDEYELTVGLQRFVELGGTLFAEEVVDWDANFTGPGDVLRANLEWLERRGLPWAVGQGARVAEGSRLERAVVGDGAEVQLPTELRRAVVLPGARVRGGTVLEDALVAGDDLVVPGGPG